MAEIIADTKLKAGPIIRAVGFISYTCDDMLNGLRLKRRRVADAKEAADQKKQDAKAKLEEKAKAILTGDDTFEKWSKDKLLTVLKYKEVPGVAHQMDGVREHAAPCGAPRRYAAPCRAQRRAGGQSTHPLILYSRLKIK